ncbi:MAG: GyrI-like domain-containing protein [Rubrivivax sp.]
MHRVLDHVERHIDSPLDLAELARIAHFSPFHFHRLFAAWTGERLGDHTRRRRLEIGASRLLTEPRATVLAVALAVGFGSAEAFARSFKLRFGVSPTAWRVQQAHERRVQRADQRRELRAEHRNPDQGLRKFDQTPLAAPDQHRGFDQPLLESPLDVRLETLPPADIAYLRHLGPYGEPIGVFWTRVVVPWMKANGLEHSRRYGISHDDPSIVAASQCRYDACVEVPADLLLTQGAQCTTLPGGRYAVLDFSGSPETIGDAWTALLRDWLPASGLRMDNRPCFELYPPEDDASPNRQCFACRICIPVTGP